MKAQFLFPLLILLNSCGIGDGKGPLNFSVRTEEPVRAEDVNFEVFKKRVLPKCIGCHKGWTREEAVNRFTKENLPEESRLFVTIKKGEMPKNSPPLSSELLEITRNYVANIRYQRPVEAPLPDDGQPVSFESLKRKVFSVSCLPCHANRQLKDAEALATSKWIDHESPEKSRLLTSVLSGKMPKQRNLLTDNQIELIRRYLRSFR